MSLNDAPTEDVGGEDVRYDLAGNPLPPLPKAPPSPVVSQRVSGQPAPGFASPPAFTPPPGLTPPGQPLVWGGAAPAAKSSPSGPVLYFGLGMAAVVLVGLIFVLRALKPVIVTAPTHYKTYTAIDNTFSCDQPDGWKMHETGATNGNLATVTFEQSHVRVRVVSDATGSIMGDIATASNNSASSETLPGMPPPPPPKPAVEQLHERDVAQITSDLPGYKEGTMQKLDSRVGDARVSEWTADGGKMHGYRVTMLGGDREFTVICLSPERNWSILQPAFQHIITSIVPGNG